MITKGEKKATIYKGAYKPASLLKNGEEIFAPKKAGTVENEAEFFGTYDDYLTVYGKTGYSATSNEDPPSPDNVKEILHSKGSITVTDSSENEVEYQIPELLGIEVSEAMPYNYKETVNGVTRYYIADSLENGKIVRRVAKRVVNEKSTLSYCAEMESCYRIGISDFTDRLSSGSQYDLSEAVVCDKFKAEFGFRASETANNYEHTSTDTANYFMFQYIILNKDRLSELSAEGARAWLKDNNVTFYYPINMPYTEKIDFEIKTHPNFTKIQVENENARPRLGLSECLKLSEL